MVATSYVEEEEARIRTQEWARLRGVGEAMVRAAAANHDLKQRAWAKEDNCESAPCTPDKNDRDRSQAAVMSPLSKASTPERSTAAARYLEVDSKDDKNELELEIDQAQSSVSPSAVWEDVSPAHCSRNGKKLRMNRKVRAKQFFGQYDEEDPEPFLLLQDLLSWHKRGVERVSVTILSDDEPFDPSSLVLDGAADLDIDANVEPVKYDEENPEQWLLAQDLTALSRRGAERVSITVLPDPIDVEDSGKPQHAEQAGVEIETDVLGSFPYREEEPELWLLQQDLLALHRRGVEMVSVTILTDDKPADVRELVWPVGSGHVDLRSHYCDAIAYPHDEQEEDALQEYLLLQDLMALQDAGADAVSVTCISHDAEEDLTQLQRSGWELSHPCAAPSGVLLLT